MVWPTQWSHRKPCFIRSRDRTSIISRYDGTIYARALGARNPGTHNLHFVDDADHNFTEVCVYLGHWEKKSDLFVAQGRDRRYHSAVVGKKDARRIENRTLADRCTSQALSWALRGFHYDTVSHPGL